MKSIKQLGIFSGRPHFSDPLHVGAPNTPGRKEFMKHIELILSRNRLTNSGPVLKEFEERLANRLGVKHVVTTCNGTMALELTIMALEIKGDVLLPSFTFVATAHAVKMRGLKPIFCDIDPKTYCLDPASVQNLVTPHSSDVLGVHLWGRICDVEKLELICSQNNLKLFFDASHAFGCTKGGKSAGVFGIAEIFSFHATKFFHTIEGGAIATSDDSLAEELRIIKNFGFTGYDTVSCLGTNGKMSEISAAMGLANLIYVDQMMQRLTEQYALYQSILEHISGLKITPLDSQQTNNCQYVMFEIEDSASIRRDDLIEILHAENILARRYFYPGCHRMEPYKSEVELLKHNLLPVTESVSSRIICLPNSLRLSNDDIRNVCKIIRFAVENGKEISRALTHRNKRMNNS